MGTPRGIKFTLGYVVLFTSRSPKVAPGIQKLRQVFKLQAWNHQMVSVIFRSITCLLLTTDYRVLDANHITSAAPPEAAGAPNFRALAAAMSKFIRWKIKVGGRWVSKSGTDPSLFQSSRISGSANR